MADETNRERPEEQRIRRRHPNPQAADMQAEAARHRHDSGNDDEEETDEVDRPHPARHHEAARRPASHQ
jgi:hypothetical protein